MAKYTKGTLHANGETIEFTGDVNAKRLRDNFPASYFFTEDRTKEYGIISGSPSFVELDVDPTPTPLLEKPNCDNWGKCESEVMSVIGVEILPDTVAMKVGEKNYVQVKISPENATNKTFSLEIMNTDIATVIPATGEITGVSAGETFVKVTTLDGGFTATAKVIVAP